MQAILNKQQEQGLKCLLGVIRGECKQGQGIVAVQPWLNIHGRGNKACMHYSYATLQKSTQPNEKAEM